MKNYYNVDTNKKVYWIFLLFLLLIPFIGAWFFGTKLTSYYSETRTAMGTLCFIVLFFHIVIILYYIF